MVMTSCGAPEPALRERLLGLWRAIEDAHEVYLETEDSPDKLQQRKKLDGYITEYLSLVPPECKFGLPVTGKVFQRTAARAEFSAYRARLGWEALARYAGNLLAQPWRREYRTVRLYCGYYKHEVESNMAGAGAEAILQAMGYKEAGGGRMALELELCPDTVTAVARDALIAACECQIMCGIWEAALGSGSQVRWSDVVWARARRAGDAAAAAARLTHAHDTRSQRGYLDDQEIYSNVPVMALSRLDNRLPDLRHNSSIPCHRPAESPVEDPIMPIMQPAYMVPATHVMPNIMYQVPTNYHPDVPVTIPQCNPVPMMTPYRPVPYYYPVQAPYMMPTPIYAPIRQAANVPVNGGYTYPQYPYPTVPTGQLVELEPPTVYENGKYDDRAHRKSRLQVESSRRNSMSKSGFSDVSLPSLPRSDTQPALSKAREDGMGTYGSWDYVFKNLSSKDQSDQVDGRSRHSPSVERDSRTLERLDRDERRIKYQPTTLDLEDGLQALSLDRSYDEEVYRTAKVNENLMRLKQEQELKRAKQLAKRQASEERKKKTLEPIGNPGSDGLIPSKVAPDKVRLLTKKDVKERKEVLKQQNGSSHSDLKKVKKPVKISSTESDKSIKGKSLENGFSNVKTTAGSSSNHHNNYDLKTHLVVTLDEVESRKSPVRSSHHNGDSDARSSSSRRNTTPEALNGGDSLEKWECAFCTYLNGPSMACEMCGKSKKAPQIQPLTSGGRECPTCTLVNKRDAKVCDACGNGLEHCPTYI